MSKENDYLSEFEREFEFDELSSEYEGEMYDSDEFEYESDNDFSSETNEDSEIDNEYELENEFSDQSNEEPEPYQEYNLDNEYGSEDKYQDPEAGNYLQEYDSPDQEYEERIFSALNGEHESSFEMEQELDKVLYELEMDHFWGAAKKFWNKHKNKLKSVAGNFIPGGTLTKLAKFAGSDLRGLLKSDLIKKGLTMAANTYLPGVGGAVAGRLLNSETPSTDTARAQAREAVKVAKDAYRNMALLMPKIQAGNVPNQIRRFSQQALSTARKRNSSYRGKSKKVIPIKSGSTVVVKQDRIIIYS